MDDFLHQFLENCRVERQLSEHSLKAYQSDIEKFFKFLKSKKHEGEILNFTVQQWLSSAHHNGISPRSLARYLASLRAFFHYALKTNFLINDPTCGVKTPKIGKSLPKTIDVDKVQALLNTQQTEPLAVRDFAIMELLYSSGLRISELIDSNIHDLLLDEGLMRVTGKGNKERIVPVGKMALAQIHQWLVFRNLWASESEQALFVSQSGLRLSVRSVQKRLKEWGIKCGLDTNLHPHKFRHSVASHLLESSGDLRAVQEFLGHANLATTQIYTQLDFQHLAKTYDATHPRAKEKK